ncbi:hypothetical protein CERSUDRAFT_112754 [Gelatoporia subvermispora B]|uniref:Zn(2)-C6 fungal-type domain-containing protein n=1 Tax=Ceriporiopsis subvermispora (strain B) TaxID=914234 RepID=M2RKS0_CERS8|nr:hypothetical protein CERSUDRAFT_112754 [Gelatoporia subvermispora B]
MDARARPHPLHMVSLDPGGTKRKRLSKACDACHKSKRRCDGTAPCSNCYFASKNCTYTDSNGRPVPAPRNANHERPALPGTPSPTTDHAPPLPDIPLRDPRHEIAQQRELPPKRSRAAAAPRVPPPLPAPIVHGAPVLSPTGSPNRPNNLEPELMHELINLFFAHCNPQRLILHKPSFSAALSHDRVPNYLILAICAVAAPLSKNLQTSEPHPRRAGVPFFDDAVKIMFDQGGRLLSAPCLATAQALCLLEMHEVAASHSWTKHYRYFDLALQVLEESLEVNQLDSVVVARTHGSDTNILIERECTRRCFWLVQLMSWINGIYTYKPLRPRSVELMRQVPLPVDETSFELTVHSLATRPEFLHEAAPRTRYASQFGHLCRILSIYRELQTSLALEDLHMRAVGMQEGRKALDEWVASLSGQLVFSEDNLEKQLAMFETSSNSGAWCFCFMHVLHPCAYLSVLEGEAKLPEHPPQWVRDQLNQVFSGTGTRAKNTILSACCIWSYSKYYPQDKLIQVWDNDFEKVWGFRVAVVADQWRACQEAARKQSASVQASPESAPLRTYAAAAASSLASTPTAVSPTPGRSPSDTHFRRGALADGPRQSPPRAPYRAPEHPLLLQQQQTPRDAAHSLPSLKASGLLDSWKPPSEAFANTLSISPPGPAAAAAAEERRASVAALLHPHAQPMRGAGVAASVPVGMNWLANGP